MARKNTEQPVIAIDLFSGCGGLSTGLKEAGFIIGAAVEIENKASEVYRLNHPDVLLFEQDIRDLPAAELLRKTGLRKGELALLAGCPPCQGFSRMRKRNRSRAASDSRNDLIWDFVRFVRAFKPLTVMLENVPGLADHYRFRQFRRKLELLGYKGQFEILDASMYGVAQRRKRLIYIAGRGFLPSLARPGKTKVTVRDAIGFLPTPSRSDDELHALVSRHSEKVMRIIASIPKDGGSRNGLPTDLVLDCHRASNGFRDVYGRMKWDDVSPTITGGCYNPSKGRFLHPIENRAITLREASLLQGFPRNYRFLPQHGREATSLMIGNALPPPFITAHARQLILAMRGINNKNIVPEPLPS